jgi:hypothetical protein
MSMTKLIEMTIVRHAVDAKLEVKHARWLRGAFARRVDRPEFHQHVEEGLLYRHPLIRYDVSTGDAVVAGLGVGAVLLRGVPPFTEITLGPETHRVARHQREAARVEVGPTSTPMQYKFKTPYLALNQDNHEAWDRGSTADRRRLLERVVIGNLLSLSKSIGLHVEERLTAEVELEPDGWHELKPGVRLRGFRGVIRVNYLIPDLWGVGKSSARGFGTLTMRGE